MMNIDKIRICEYCKVKPLIKTQKRFCSQSCHFRDLNDSREKWTTDMTPELHQMMEGILLSDGSLELSKTTRYPRLNISQSAAHKEYLEYIGNQLGLGPERIYRKIKYHKKLDKTYDSYALTTTTSPLWADYYKRWYPNGKKIIPKDFEITPISLLHAYLGDGCLSSYISNKKYGCQRYYTWSLYVDSFSEQDLKSIVIPQLVDEVCMNIRFMYRKQWNKKLYCHIYCGQKSSIENFFDYVSINPVSCYNYKFDCILK